MVLYLRCCTSCTCACNRWQVGTVGVRRGAWCLCSRGIRSCCRPSDCSVLTLAGPNDALFMHSSSPACLPARPPACLPATAEPLPADIAAEIEQARKQLDGKEVDYEATMEVGGAVHGCSTSISGVGWGWGGVGGGGRWTGGQDVMGWARRCAAGVTYPCSAAPASICDACAAHACLPGSRLAIVSPTPPHATPRHPTLQAKLRIAREVFDRQEAADMQSEEFQQFKAASWEWLQAGA